ncbi:hypothetical protein [Streptomyces bacillaris]|uniref:hypothetical protein n=1 Tax=Streptomyces bacillaris TaxID=68179 RepID=UPI003652F807
MSPGRGRLLGAAVALALAVTASGGAAVAAGPPTGSGQVTRAALAECPPGPVWANTGGADPQLVQYSPDEDVLSSAPLARDYGDIAFSPDGSTLYGVNFPGADMTTLCTIDTVTGAETASVPVTGPLDDLRVSQGNSAVNGLTARADGMLIDGSFVSEQIFLIDPATGVSPSRWSRRPATASTARRPFRTPGSAPSPRTRSRNRPRPPGRRTPATPSRTR